MPSRPAVLLAALLVASTVVGAEGTGAATTDPNRESAASRPEKKPSSGATSRAGAERRKKVPDEDVIAHLDEIERLELLQHLELFDTAGPTRRGR